MKSITEYTDQPITDLFNRTGAFFAFSQEQLKAAAIEGVEYQNLGAGLIAPVGKAKEINEGLKHIGTEGRAQRIKEFGAKAIIRYELFNFEAFYTSDLEDATDALTPYGITPEQVRDVYNHIQATEDLSL